MLDAGSGEGTDAVAERVEILAVSVDGPEEQEMMVDNIVAQGGAEPSYPLLSDPDAAVIRRYGILNPGGFRGMDIPHPTTLVIDTAGVVRWKVVETDYTLRPTNDDIVAALRAVVAGEEPAPATPVPIEPFRAGGG